MWFYVTLIVLFLLLFGLGTYLVYRSSSRKRSTGDETPST